VLPAVAAEARHATIRPVVDPQVRHLHAINLKNNYFAEM